MDEEVVDLWEAEDPPDEDYVVEQVTRCSISASNPWSCMRQASFVLKVRVVRLIQTILERHICLVLSELLWEGSP